MADPRNRSDSDGRSEAWELFAFALDLYRAPLKFLPYVSGERPIPAGFDALLEALNKRAGEEQWQELSERLNASPEQLRNAGFFLVKRLLFAEGADHYRVLGLDSDADISQARERYRLLMALFHPDRNRGGDEWTEQYAPRINEAYNTLKNPSKKRAYDHRVRGEAPWGEDIPAPADTKHRSDGEQRHAGRAEPGPRPQSRSAGSSTGGRVRRGSRVWPRFHVWFGLLLVGVAVWFGVQVYESGALKLAPREGPKESVAAQSRSEAPAPAAEKASDNVGSVGEDSATKPEVAGPEAVGVVPPERTETDCPAAGCGASEAAAPVPGEGQVDTGHSEAADGPSVAATPQNQAAPAPVPEPQEQPPAPAAQEAPGMEPQERSGEITQGDIDFLISHFIEAYETGDIGKFLGLFGSHVRSDEGIGRDLVAKRYKQLFRSTRKRSMQVRDLRWGSEGEGVVTVNFLVVVNYQERDSAAPSRFLAGVELLAYRDIKGLKISKFIQQEVAP